MTTHLIIDTREPWPHPWASYWPDSIVLTRTTLETGDLALAGAPDGAVVERKTVPDLLGCIGRERDRFTRELLRARFCASFCIVVEGALLDVLRQARGVSASSIMGTIAAWTRRGWPVVFCGTQALAADYAYRFLSQYLAEAERLVRSCSSLERPVPSSPPKLDTEPAELIPV